jgi:16S rRNA (cytidine1402-2'-O)-methyltransferase
LFEAPHRAAALLADLEALVPESRVAACRELTKLHEEVVIGTPAEVGATLAAPRGELTFVVSQIPPAAAPAVDVDLDALVVAAVSAGLPQRTVVELLRAAGVPRREAYRASGKRDVTGR